MVNRVVLMENLFSIRLSEILEERDLKQKQLAEKIGVTEVTISRYINAEREPRPGILVNIAKSLDVSVDYLLGVSNVQTLGEGAKAAEGTAAYQIGQGSVAIRPDNAEKQELIEKINHLTAAQLKIIDELIEHFLSKDAE